MNDSASRPGALVVYESMFGNTRDVATAVADGLSSRMDVTTVEVGDARCSSTATSRSWLSGGRPTPSA